MKQLATKIHEDNVKAGWWDNFPNKEDRYELAMVLIFSELFEAMEGDRKNLMDNHLPQYPMLIVELADAVIRLFDLIGAFELEEFIEFIDRENYEHDTEMSYPEYLYLIMRDCFSSDLDEVEKLGYLVWYLIPVSESFASEKEIDFWEVVYTKLEYNKNRADHKRENRAKENGKQF